MQWQGRGPEDRLRSVHREELCCRSWRCNHCCLSRRCRSLRSRRKRQSCSRCRRTLWPWEHRRTGVTGSRRGRNG
eukprot:scaffold16092_cov127-Isochrysis_galbana.AAC.7